MFIGCLTAHRHLGHIGPTLGLGKHAELETALEVWFSSARSQNVTITDAILREKAKQFGTELAVHNFQYSNGWLQRFKARHGIASQVICSESAGVDVGVITNGRADAMKWIKDYSLRDVYNLDETGLFYRMMPDRSLTTADKTKGIKKPKDRISVMLCANADGSDKLKPLIIGNVQNPRCFKQFNPSLYCDYYANKKAWMVNGILQDFLKAFNHRMVRENRSSTADGQRPKSHYPGYRSDSSRLLVESQESATKKQWLYGLGTLARQNCVNQPSKCGQKIMT